MNDEPTPKEKRRLLKAAQKGLATVGVPDAVSAKKLAETPGAFIVGYKLGPKTRGAAARRGRRD